MAAQALASSVQSAVAKAIHIKVCHSRHFFVNKAGWDDVLCLMVVVVGESSRRLDTAWILSLVFFFLVFLVFSFSLLLLLGFKGASTT